MANSASPTPWVASDWSLPLSPPITSTNCRSATRADSGQWWPPKRVPASPAPGGSALHARAYASRGYIATSGGETVPSTPARWAALKTRRSIAVACRWPPTAAGRKHRCAEARALAEAQQLVLDGRESCLFMRLPKPGCGSSLASNSGQMTAYSRSVSSSRPMRHALTTRRPM